MKSAKPQEPASIQSELVCAVADDLNMADLQHLRMNYLRLISVLGLAVNQAAFGKGLERHANSLPFEDQPMQQISKLLDSPDGMAFQVMKKCKEALGLPTYDAQIHELLGVINYTAGIVIFLQDKSDAELEV